MSNRTLPFLIRSIHPAMLPDLQRPDWHPIVLVFGSLNVDWVIDVPHLPHPGETLTGSSLQQHPGGKGANQAVAAARLGARTAIVGRVGQDSQGEWLRSSLRRNGVDDRALLADPSPTGLATIAVATAGPNPGENQIIVVPGANGQVGARDVERLKPLLPGARVLLLQLEVPIAAVMAAAEAGKAAGVTVILDPAPARALPDRLYPWVDILTPNQTEAAALVGFAVTDRASAQRAAQILVDRGVATVLITLGAEGVVGLHQGSPIDLDGIAVTAIDSTAAGDAFNGGLAAGLAAGLDLAAAIDWAMAAGAIAVTRAGAQPSLPTQTEIQMLLQGEAPPELPSPIDHP
jgi:ribokinase